MSTTINLPKYSITHPLIIDLVSGIISILGKDGVAGIYLGGSLAIGGFDETKSDIDFLVVMQKLPSQQQIEQLTQLHSKIRNKLANRLYTNYEGEYLTAEQVKSPLEKDITSLHLGSDGHFREEQQGPSLVVDLWKIRESGFVVIGPTPSSIIGGISVVDMLNAKKELFNSWWLPKLRGKELMDDEYQAYAVLTMTRIMYGFVRRGEVSKKRSADWFTQEYPQYSKLVEMALTWKPGMVMDMQPEVYELISFVNKTIN